MRVLKLKGFEGLKDVKDTKGPKVSRFPGLKGFRVFNGLKGFNIFKSIKGFKGLKRLFAFVFSRPGRGSLPPRGPKSSGLNFLIGTGSKEVSFLEFQGLEV